MIKGEQIEFSVPELLNLGSYYLDVNLEAGRANKTAIYYKDGSYSFLDLWHLTNRVGNVFKGLGVEPENRVLLILEDSPEWVAAWLAAMKVGAVGTHAYTYLMPDDYAYLVNLIKPKVVVVDKSTLPRVRAGARGSRYPKAFLVAGENIRDLKQGEFSLNEMIASADDRLEMEPTHRDDPAFWNFSGGTTGKPKGVPHMHRDSVLSYHSYSAMLGYKTDDIVLLVPKLFFHYARDNGLLFALRSGAAVILYGQRATAALMFELIGKFRPTVMLNVPTMMRAMIQTRKHERVDLSCLRLCLSSGEVLSPQLYEEWLGNFGTEVIDRLGSAESGMGYLCNRPGAVQPGSSGKVAPLAEIKLVDDEGLEVSRGQPGLLLTRSDASAQYYVREHEKSKATFLGDEWINTGDIFIRDEADYFWFVGRADEMVKVSGVWVSPLEIERILQECPSVRECATLGIKDGDGLLKIQAFVALRDGARDLAEKRIELERFCRERLAPHKIPRGFEFLDELPKTGQGKIDRRLLRERVC
jgi:benzoate-CoA ligase family protein